MPQLCQNSFNKPSSRLLIVAMFALLWMLAVTGRLAYLQLIRHSDYLTRAQRQQQRTIEISPKRGEIFDRNMRSAGDECAGGLGVCGAGRN